MAGTDFYDDDLAQRDAPRRPVVAATEEDRTIPELQRPVGDLNLARMARHREEIERQVAESVHELDRLRIRQDEVERKRKELEEQRQKQDEYERGRRELSDRLNQSLIMMEKEEVKSERLLEVLRNSRARFKDALAEIESIDDSSWAEEEVREELNRALTILDEARVAYNKTVAKIEALMGDDRAVPVDARGMLFRDGAGSAGDRSFATWLWIGFAASLPLILVSLLIAAGIAAMKWKGLW